VVVDTVHRQLLAANSVSGEVLVHADFSDHVCHRPNGAAISAIGRAYVGSVGFDIDSDSAPEQGAITIVEPDGQVHWGTSVDLWFPNGMAFTIGERSLIVAETLAARLSEYEIAEDGSLGDRRDWAALPKDTYPDGLCIDSEGAVWVADAGGKCVLRVARGGTILDRIDLPRRVYACALGGGTGRTLYLMTAKTHRQAARAARTGSILAVEVSVPAVIF
jgi:sugar lactone lactonase YvrE